jgi:hydroxylaminobenzene mutase
MFLFLVGLITGFLEQKFSNPRMGLAAHLEGVMNGTLLIALGAIWTEVRLSPRLRVAAYCGALYGTYANWGVTTLAAIFGTAALSPITAANRSAQPWQEGIVTLGFMSVGVTIVGCSILVLWGLRRRGAPR